MRTDRRPHLPVRSLQHRLDVQLVRHAAATAAAQHTNTTSTQGPEKRVSYDVTDRCAQLRKANKCGQFDVCLDFLNKNHFAKKKSSAANFESLSVLKQVELSVNLKLTVGQLTWLLCYYPVL